MAGVPTTGSTHEDLAAAAAFADNTAHFCSLRDVDPRLHLPDGMPGDRWHADWDEIHA